MNSENSHIQIAGVSKQYGELEALRNIDLDIRKGEFFSLLGPSGCGKTTLLKILGGFESPTRGDVFIDGERVNHVPPHRRKTNMVFQNYALFPHLDVVGNIGYGLRRSKVSAGEKEDKVRGLIDLMQLHDLGNRNVEKLSGGQKQRVALARSLAMDPSVLLLDEPLGALDKKLRDEMQVELRDIQRRVGITFVFVTHDQEEAMALSDRVAVLFDGEIAQVDSPRTLYDQPHTESVASFVGTINLFDAEVVAVDEEKVAVKAADCWTVHVPRARIQSAAIGCKLQLAVRPERVAVNAASGADGISGRALVRAVSFRGDRSYLDLDVEDGSARLNVVQSNTSTLERGLLAVGDSVAFSCRQADLIVLC